MKSALALRATILGVLLAAFSLACGDDQSPVPAPSARVSETASAAGPRSFQLGVSSQPIEASEKAYIDAFELAGRLGEVVLIQRAPPWDDFLPGGSVSARTERLTLIERRLVEQHDLKLLLAIDPTTPANRGVLAGVPPDLAEGGFASTELRSALVSYAKYLALNYKPAYIALGVEVDLIFHSRGDASFRNFISLYFEAYDAIKEVSPGTQVFPTFQYESLLGILDNDPPVQPGWSLVTRFQPKIDLLVVSSFPGSVFPRLSDVPVDYYEALRGRFDLPVAFISVGWASIVGGQRDEHSQLSFLLRTIAAAERLESPFLIWFLARDQAASGDNGPPQISTMGLFDSLGKAKAGLQIWDTQLRRPLR